MENREFQIVVCKSCGETKKRFLGGKYPNCRDKKWVDEKKDLWNGHKCPICVREKNRNHKRLKRLKNNV